MNSYVSKAFSLWSKMFFQGQLESCSQQPNFSAWAKYLKVVLHSLPFLTPHFQSMSVHGLILPTTWRFSTFPESLIIWQKLYVVQYIIAFE